MENRSFMKLSKLSMFKWCLNEFKWLFFSRAFRFFWRSSATRIRSWMIYRSNALGLFGSSGLPPRAPVGRALRIMRSPQNSSVAKIFEEVKEKQTWMDSNGGRKLPTMLHHRLCYWSILGLAHQGRVAPQTLFPWHGWLRIASISSVEAGWKFGLPKVKIGFDHFPFFLAIYFPENMFPFIFRRLTAYQLIQVSGSVISRGRVQFFLFWLGQIMEVFATHVATIC